MSLRLSYFAAKDWVYVNGLDSAPPGSKIWLMRNSGGTASARSSGFPGFDKDEVLVAVRGLVGSLDWDAVAAMARVPARPGRPPGMTAASWRADPATSRAGAQPWTAAYAEGLSDLVAFKIPEPTRLLVDHREPLEMVERLGRVTNLVVEVQSLDTGDFLVPGALVVERKTVADFVTSIIDDDKRLFTQAARLSVAPERAVVVVEGSFADQQRMTLEQVTGALSYLEVILRVPVLNTVSLAHTAHAIARMVRHAAHGLGYDLPIREPGPKDAPSAALHVVAGIPGVSTRLAKTLLAHFGTVRALAQADVKELLAVDGIGPQKARAIVAAFTTKIA
jgi:ERCC4-type nuclease